MAVIVVTSLLFVVFHFIVDDFADCGGEDKYHLGHKVQWSRSGKFVILRAQLSGL